MEINKQGAHAPSVEKEGWGMEIASPNYMRNIFGNYKIFNIDPAKLRSKEFFKNMLEYRESVFKQFKHTMHTMPTGKHEPQEHLKEIPEFTR